MKAHHTKSDTYACDHERIAIHVLREMTTQQRRERRATFADLRSSLAVPTSDLKAVLAALDGLDLIDAERLSLTLSGFAVGMRLLSQRARVAA